ncbi:50S ribosomal protein L15 [Fibrivirga algicola]|uniref:Large ribosomal subunit protein uL15 n=1 Tax=Fibrivirga algicola TaxID=2950420 RepID=A0ABX0QGK7_9BACT|nr:50S ribosomal protein L15 [Fibrivirga algicola]NID09858.1 50S ribosomal protein L15 [Fibrivirga algicola]
MNLSHIKPAKGSVKQRKRVGRGQGSGMGGTSTRGHKGAQSRSGYSRKLNFEGGQMPLQRRLPKFGFTNPTRVEYKPINLDTLQELATAANVTTIDFAVLREHGLAGKNDLIKVLSRGEVTSALEVSAHGFSSSAKEAIEKAGGKVTVIERIAKKESAI